MSIASEKIKFATERFLLLRMNPARYVLPVLNGAVYESTLDVIINKVERNGVALTKDSSTPSVNDHWYQNETTGLLQIKLAGAPNDTTNVIVVYYYLFYTGTIFRSISEDPEDDATTIREWQPRITKYPNIIQSFDNIIAGILTISDTNIELINEDGQFQEYLSENDSFYNKEVDIWLCINSVENIQKIFTGTIKSLSASQNTVRIFVTDVFNKLKQPAYMGDTVDEVYLRRNALSFPELTPKDDNKPLPYIVGTYSRFDSEQVENSVTPAVPGYIIGPNTNEAYCTNYTPVISATTNRVWICCRIGGAVETQSFGTAEAYIDHGNFRYIRFSSLSNVEVGDTFKWTNAGNPYYALILHVGTFTHSAVNYNLVIDLTNTYSLSDTVTPLKSFAARVYFNNDPVAYPLRYEQMYTVLEVSTLGGNKNIFIELNDDFESEFTPAPNFINPTLDRIVYRTSNSASETHAEIIEDFATQVGLSVDATSFAAADAALDVKARFQVPYFNELDFHNYLDYIQDVLKSTLGFIKVNSALEVEYYLLAAPSSTAVRDNGLMLNQGTGCRVEYQDIVTQIVAYNPHNNSVQALERTPSPSETRESTKSKYLNGLTNTDRFVHVLEEITSRIDDHINLKSLRKAVYSFSTATEDIDTELGDDIELQNKIVLGTSDTQDVKIITIDKSPGSINLEAQDLKGL